MNYNKTNHSISSPSHDRRGAAVRLLCLFTVLLSCFFTSCSQEETVHEGEGTAVGFTLPSITAGAEQDAATRASLADGVKVRVLVYKTGAQSAANYVTAKDYIVQNGGTLSPDGTNLRLIDGTYDFYAITPNLDVTTSGNQPTVTVFQQKDFAVSLTTGKKITKWSAAEGSSVKCSITLNELERKCAKVNFAIDVAEDVAPTITDTKIIKAVLTNMPNTVVATGTTIDPGSGSTTLTLPATLFTTDTENPRKSSGSTILLPKTSGTFTLSMQAQFNKVTSITTQFPATAITMAFEGGKEYTFTVRLTKDKMGNTSAGLWVTISKWVTSNQDYGLGGVPTGPITTQQIGEWKTLTWESNLGGVPTGPIITGVSNWWNNIYYNPHLGSSDANSND